MFAFDGELHTRPGQDKKVALLFEVLAGDVVIARSYADNIKTDEDDDDDIDDVPDLGVPMIKIMGGAPLTLRVTMTVAPR
jgi:hypothetical protein